MHSQSTPYFVTIAVYELTGEDPQGYAAHREELSALLSEQPGYLGASETAAERRVISLTYWNDQESMSAWGASAEHRAMQQKSQAGRWIDSVQIEIAQVHHKLAFPPRQAS